MPRLSIIIPVYQEAGHLRRFLDQLLAVSFPWAVELVAVDDCSSDGSWEILGEYAARPGFVAVRQEQNRGKGAALHRGFALARGELIVVQDADFEYDPGDLVRLVMPVLDDKADIVYGSRFSRSSPQVHRTFHYLGNRLLTLFSNLLSGLYLSDMETCYKVFRSEILKGLRLDSRRFGFEPEVTAKIAKLKVRVHEYPISYFPRTYAEGKKINWRDGVAALWFIAKYNLQPLSRAVRETLPRKYVPARRQWL
ncbi:MAG: glycosyltransferase family 2 protein [Candidatus Schekmanbacteria bacterium]|nr:glycosyltransferase family 2 protein [Candidatus Schekmanbacteria bacterium]